MWACDCAGKLGIAGEKIRQPAGLESPHDAMGIDDAAAPIEAGLEPPGLRVPFPDFLGIGQAPIAKFRHQQRQIGATLVREIRVP